jgi:hypothetical protein
MKSKTKRIKRVRRLRKKGKGLANTLINKLPVELHVPGTKFEERYKRGDTGINKLDNACMLHDKAYTDHTDVENRTIADKVLRESAKQAYKDKSRSLVKERIPAYIVDKIFAVKNRFKW